MKKLFFSYVWLNLTRIAELRKENLVKHMRKRTIQTGRLFFSSSLTLKHKIKMKKILFSLLATLFAAGVFAQVNTARQAAINDIFITTAQGLTPIERATAATNKIADALNISKKQRAALLKINLDAAQKMDEIAKYAQSKDIEKKHSVLFEDTNAKIMRILKSEQKERYQGIIKKSMQYKKMQSNKKQ